jgi:DNA polymerase-4
LARKLLAREATGTSFRPIGIGTRTLVPRAGADRGDLADTETPKLAAVQATIDTLRNRFGSTAIGRGRSLR